MTQPSITTDIHEPLNIHRDFSAQITLYDHLAFEDLTKTSDFTIGQISHPCRRVDASLFEQFLARRSSYAINVRKPDLDCLFSRYVNTCNTRQSCAPVLLLALALLVFRVRANDPNDPAPPNNLATFASLAN